MDHLLPMINEISAGLVALGDTCNRVSDAYGDAAALLIEEQRLIGQSNLSEIEALQSEKARLTEVISVLTDELRQQIGVLKEFGSSHHLELPEGMDLDSVTQVGKFTLWLSDSLTGDRYEHRLLRKITSDFQNSLSKFRNAMERFQKTYEIHYIVLKKSMGNIQRSYRFWQDMAAEVEQTYTAVGKQRVKDSSSLLKIRV